MWPSGKALDSGSRDRRFESFHPSHVVFISFSYSFLSSKSVTIAFVCLRRYYQPMKTKMTAVITLLKSIHFEGRIPKRDEFNEQLVDAVLEGMKGTYLNREIVVDVVGDLAFEKLLETSATELTDSDAQIVAKDAVEYLDALPAKYEFYFLLPNSEEEIEEIKLRHNISIKKLKDGDEILSERLEQSDAGQGGLRRLLAGIKPGKIGRPMDLKKGNTVLIVEGMGYVTRYDGPIDIDTDEPMYIFKVVMSHFMLTRALANKTLTYNGVPWSTKSSFAYYCFMGNQLITRHEGDTDDQALVSSKSFLRGSLTDNSQTITELKRLINNKYSRLKSVKHEQENIRNALFWWYEAYKSKLYFYQIIVTVTGFDSLMGTGADIKEYKANLVSSAISGKVQDEKYCYDSIVSLYDLRNKIVHGSKPVSALSRHTAEGKTDVELSYRGQAMLGAYILKRLRKLMSS